MEEGRFTDDQAKFFFDDLGVAALFGAEGHDAERLDRRGDAGHGRHAALDADVVGAGRAGANANALPLARQAVIGRAQRHSQVEVHRIQLTKGFVVAPAAQGVDDRACAAGRPS